MKYNLSLALSGELSHDHNARRIIPDYAEKERTSQNIVLERDASKVVSEWYKEELKAENARKKPSRRIEDIYAHYKKLYSDAKEKDRALSRNKKSVDVKKYRNKAKCYEKELIIQIGDRNAHPDDTAMKHVFGAYVKRFQQENPCFRVTGAYVHMDEATPHLHLDFVYKADKEATIHKMYSFDNALKQENYVKYYDKTQCRTISAFEQWRKRQVEILTEIAKEQKIEINPEKAEEKRQHLAREAYIAYNMEKEAKEKQKEAEKKRQEAEKAEKEAEKTIKSHKIAIESKEKELNRLNQHIIEANTQIDEIQETLDMGYIEIDRLEKIKETYKNDIVGAMMELAKKETYIEKLERAIRNNCSKEQAEKILNTHENVYDEREETR